jgi:hypothetical protein|tara:strand:+ start:453 stop:656 length:204 start_codon:yes stop_codon:yes gene_type:complete
MNIEQEAESYRLDVRKEFDKNLNAIFEQTEQFIIKNLHNSDERDSSLRRLIEARSWCILCKDRHGLM